MKEKLMEQKLTKAAKHIGGVAIKIVSPGFDGMPDRMVLLPEGRMGFVEVKQPGKAPRPLQTARHRMLRRLGFKVYVLDDAEQIKTILTEIGGDAG
nr:MAG TPA: Nuclease [Caudoviricetes sp.]